jgi:hypothetical protein
VFCDDVDRRRGLGAGGSACREVDCEVHCNSTVDNSTAGNSTAGNSTAGNSTAGNSTAGNSTAGNSTAGNSTAGLYEKIKK